MRWLVPFLEVWCFIIDPILWLIGRNGERPRSDRLFPIQGRNRHPALDRFSGA